MKINDIILQEGVFDKIKKAFSGPEPSVEERWAKQIAGEWKKYLERLETNWAPYTHKLTTKQITDLLIKFVDKKLFGVYNLKDSPEDIKKSVLDSVKKLASEYPNVDPKGDGYDKWVESEFLEIFVQAQKLRDDPTVKPDPEKERRAKVEYERFEKQGMDLLRRAKELNAKKEREAQNWLKKEFERREREFDQRMASQKEFDNQRRAQKEFERRSREFDQLSGYKPWKTGFPDIPKPGLRMSDIRKPNFKD